MYAYRVRWGENMWAAFLLLLVGGASAQSPGDFTVLDEVLIESSSDADSYMVNGVGAPSVAFDSRRGRYLMAFEVRLPETEDYCPAGVWGLGLAHSADGIEWKTSDRPLLRPREGTFYECVAAHPSVVYNEANDSLYVFYKSEQGDEACSEEERPWGCSRYTGVGRARVGFGGGAGMPRSINILGEPVLPRATNMGFPRFVRQGDTNYLMFTEPPNAQIAVSTTFRDFEVAADVAIPVSAAPASWAEDELFNPAVVCEDSEEFPFKAFIGGRNVDGSSLILGGWGVAIASSPTSWFLGAEPVVEWSSDTDWRHWDVLRVGSDDYLVYFSEKGEDNKPRIRLALTSETWTDEGIDDKRCD
jgi:hypothetical protein